MYLGHCYEALKAFESSMNINQRAKETLWWIYNYYSSRDQDYEASKAVENAQELNQSDANTLYYIGDSR